MKMWLSLWWCKNRLGPFLTSLKATVNNINDNTFILVDAPCLLGSLSWYHHILHELTKKAVDISTPIEISAQPRNSSWGPHPTWWVWVSRCNRPNRVLEWQIWISRCKGLTLINILIKSPPFPCHPHRHPNYYRPHIATEKMRMMWPTFWIVILVHTFILTMFNPPFLPPETHTEGACQKKNAFLRTKCQIGAQTLISRFQ